MELREQVCSFRYAKKLKELKVKQKSLYIWVESGRLHTDLNPEPYHENILLANYKMGRLDINKYSAYTVAEFGEEILPEEKEIDGARYRIHSYKHTDGWGCGLECIEECSELGFECPKAEGRRREHGVIYCRHNVFEETEANVRAKMIVFLIEEKLVKVEDINRRI